MMEISALAVYRYFQAHPIVYRNLNDASRDVSVGFGGKDIRLGPNQEAEFNTFTWRWMRVGRVDLRRPARLVP